MALPISPTPVIKGEDSKKFNEQLKISERERISSGQLEKAMALLKAVLKNSKT